MAVYLAHGELVVVETDHDVLLGTAEVTGDMVVMRSGFVGRPVIVPVDEVVSVTTASDHADVEPA